MAEPRFKDTTATRKIFSLKKRIRAVAGGTSASKTISILIWCIDYAQSTENQLISVVSESYPHLSGGAIRDFEGIMKDRGYWDEKRWVRNPTTIYTFETGSKIEFVSIDSYGKAHGPRRDVLFVNECNNLSYNIVDQLITRTRHVVWLDWNPVEEFWFYTVMKPARDDIDFITLTYLDNEALDDATRKEIESHKGNKNWWTVYGEGKLGAIESRIYTNWQIIDDVPHEARLERYGLDFGYTNDPTAIIALYYLNGGYVIDEVCFLKGLANKQIADILLNQPKKALVVADSAEPKSIDEIASYGIPIMGVAKTRGESKSETFKKWSIQTVQDQQVSVTKRSVNVIKEYRNYLWRQDREGRLMNEPEHEFSHSMNAIEYAMTTLAPVKQREQMMRDMPRYERRKQSNPAR